MQTICAYCCQNIEVDDNRSPKSDSYCIECAPKRKEYINQYIAKRRRTDPLFSFTSRIRSSLRSALKRSGKSKGGKTFDLLGYSTRDLSTHLSAYLGQNCICCGEVVLQLENSHIDHIVPISTVNTESGILALNQLSNLRLICSTCNLRKNDNLP